MAGLSRVLATPFGLFLAVLLDKQIRFSRFYQSAFFMPVVLSLAIVGFIAQLVFSRDYGALNTILGRTEPPDRLARRPADQHLGGAGRRGLAARRAT